MVKLLAGGFTKIRPSYKVHHLMWSLIIPIKPRTLGFTYIHTYIYLLTEGDLQVHLPKFSQNHNWKN
jgi:hypothetical protein